MILTIILSVLTIVLMFICILKFPTLKIKSITIDTFYLPILFVAIIFLITPIFDKTEFFKILFSNSTLNPLKILILFICVSLISICLDETGFFSYIASIFINKYKASQTKLFFVLYMLISILTIFTSNDIVILTFTPFILYFAKKGNINPIPYLVMEFVAANTYSMILSIGNPTNIYLASVFNIPFLTYFIHMVLPAILTGIATLLTLYLLFRHELKKPIDVFDMSKPEIKNKTLCIICAIHLALTTILLAISNYINLEMWIICLAFAISLLLFLLIYSIKVKSFKLIKSSLRRVPYSLIPFILSMFTIIMALDSYNIFDYIYNFFLNITNEITEPILYLWSSTIACNLLNNIPMTLAFGSILSNTENIKLIYATIIGSNIGAMLTPVGALAGIMWLRILKANDVKYTFLDFMKNGAVLTIVALIASTIAILII